MGYACPVCDVPQRDGEHLANHLAFTAMLHGDAHESWLDDNAAGWREQGPAELAPRVVDHADSDDYDEVFEDTADAGRPDVDARGHGHGRGHRHGHGPASDHGAAGGGETPAGGGATRGPAAADEETARVLEEARELTERMREGGETDDVGAVGGGEGGTDDGEGGTDDGEDGTHDGAT